MIETSIQHVHADNGTLSAEHYQTFEMAKANDGILGGDDIAQIRSYAAFARAQAQAIHKSIATMGELEDVAQAKAEMTETSQTFAKVSVYADTRIGELLRELPTKQGKRTDTTSSTTQDEVTKRQAMTDAGISKSQAYDLQAMAANPEVVEAVIARAEAEGRVVSRKQVLDAIKERDAAMSDAEMTSMLYGRAKTQLAETQYDLESAKEELASERGKNLELGSQMQSLKRQLAERPEPEVIEREVEVVREVVPDEVQERIEWLEHLEKIHSDDTQKLRRNLEKKNKEIERLKVLLDGKNHIDNASWDISVLTTATNNYLSQYGGKAWAFDQFDHADEVTQKEFIKAITSLAAFSQNLVQMISDQNLEA